MTENLDYSKAKTKHPTLKFTVGYAVWSFLVTYVIATVIIGAFFPTTPPDSIDETDRTATLIALHILAVLLSACWTTLTTVRFVRTGKLI